MQPSSVSDDQSTPRANARRATTAGMGYRLAAGGLASRRGAAARPAMQATPADDVWEPILPEAWSQSRVVAWILSAAQKRSLRPAMRLRWSWLKNETIYQAVFLSTASAMVLTMMLYWGKSHAALLDGEIGRVMHEAQDARQHTYMLRAEWASLNDPGRLKPLAEKFLAMKKIDPSQFADPAKLADRLDHPPPPVAVPDEVPVSAPASSPALAPTPTPALDAAVTAAGADAAPETRVAVADRPAALPDEAPAAESEEAPVSATSPASAPALQAVAEPSPVAPTDAPAVLAPKATPAARIEKAAMASARKQEPAPRAARTYEASAFASAPRAPVPVVSASPRVYRVSTRLPVMVHSASSPQSYSPSASSFYVPAAARSYHHVPPALAPAPAAKPDLPRWLTQASSGSTSQQTTRAYRPLPRIMSEPPHSLGMPAVISLPLPVTQPSETHHYTIASGQLPALRRPAFQPATYQHSYGSPGPSLAAPAPRPMVNELPAESYAPPPYMGSVEGGSAAD